MYVVLTVVVLLAWLLVCASCFPCLCHLRLCSTAGTATEPACSEAPAADKADVISQQPTSSMGRADDAQVGSPTQEAGPTAVDTGTPTDEAVATAGAADAPTEITVSTAMADATAVVSEGTPEPVQASSPQSEGKTKTEATTLTAENSTADVAQQQGGAAVSAVDAHQTGIAAADTAAAAATADTPVAAANNAAAADAVVAEAVVADVVADAVAATDAAAKAAASPASTDGTTDAAAAAMSHIAGSEEGAASHDLAAAAAGPKSESDHTTKGSVTSSVKEDQTAASLYQLSSKQAFAAAQYATGMAPHDHVDSCAHGICAVCC